MGAAWASSTMPGKDEGSGVEHAREQQVVPSNAGEDDLEAASGAAATGTDERDENVKAICEDAINEADKARSFVHGALSSCFESIFMALVGLQLQEVSHELSEIKIIQDPSHLLFLAMGTFTSVVNYTAGAKATLKVHEKGAYTFPMTRVSPLLYLGLEFIAAPVFVVVGSLIAWCAMLLVMVFFCLLPIFYIMDIISGERVDFVEIALSVVSLPNQCSSVGLNLALEGPGSLMLIGGDRPMAAIDSSRILNASGIIIDVLVWVILFTNLSYS
ncbi:Hypothetical Protein FCC1311_039022 [Hondaea fermentalgiana]|uniref:Uncharacterized protein n=1 Tax=Hondaea fermentalgiana TaxID=2315210 RepID=A0A2R5GBH3_9STRA|nr:Hypothetical Protein FCC1311_039022 [Hondaea fermentalgiana]|eukprot:GBG27679.1 Hypothetical Protein FCC1311_039022 [Hondaea fermentalgiana]